MKKALWAVFTALGLSIVVLVGLIIHQVGGASSEAAYVTALREAQPNVREATDDQLIELGEILCEAFGRGVTPTDMARGIRTGTHDISPTEARVLGSASALALIHLCPGAMVN